MYMLVIFIIATLTGYSIVTERDMYVCVLDDTQFSLFLILQLFFCELDIILSA